MNVIESLAIRSALTSNAVALVDLKNGSTCTFRELGELAKRYQRGFEHLGVITGDSVLLALMPGPALYAMNLALLGLGARLIFIEPFMKLERIAKIVEEQKPKVFVSSGLGFFWGLRIKTIRKIPHWVGPKNLARSLTDGETLKAVDVNPDTPGIITFTSGTTGLPKGVVRTHETLHFQNRILVKAIGSERHQRPDLCIFANLVLANLAIGRASLLVPPSWSSRSLARVGQLPSQLKPATLSCGPAYLKNLLSSSPAVRDALSPSFESIHIGGALTDCSFFERGFSWMPNCEWLHVYGSSEAEPVCVTDARVAVKKSRDQGYFQTLWLGKPADGVKLDLNGQDQAAWVSGKHVCPFYLGSTADNQANKRQGDDHKMWHNLGDRLAQSAEGFWYAGRSGQPPGDFELEQSVYSYLQSSASFLAKNYVLHGEQVKRRERDLRKQFSQLSGVVETKIVRDKRHRARIDRTLSLGRSVKT